MNKINGQTEFSLEDSTMSGVARWFQKLSQGMSEGDVCTNAHNTHSSTLPSVFRFAIYLAAQVREAINSEKKDFL